MSGKLVSQFKDEETIESALKSCHENVRSMKSGAVLTEVLALLKNEEYAKDALTVLGNFLSNSSELSAQRERLSADANAFAVMNILLDTNADIHICDDQGNGVLHWVVQDLAFDITFPSFSCTLSSNRVSTQERSRHIRELVKFGAKLNKANSVGRTALHEACMRGQLEVCDTLLELGANPNLMDIEGRLPIQLLCSSDSVNISSVQKFLKIGTNVPLESSDIDSNLDIVTCKTSRQTRTIARVERTY